MKHNFQKKIFCLTLILFFLSSAEAFSLTDTLFTEDFVKAYDSVKYLEVFCDSRFNFPKTVFQKDDVSLATFALIYGLKLSCIPFDFCLYQRSTPITFSTANTFTNLQEYAQYQKNWAWSFIFNFSHLTSRSTTFPLYFYLGTLGFSKVMTGFKRPSFYSSPSAFSSGLSINNGLGIYGASKSASEKPFSSAMAFNSKHTYIQFFITENAETAFSLYLKAEPSDFIKTQLLFAMTQFHLSPKKQTSWKRTQPDFIPDQKSAFTTEALLSIPFFSLKTTFTAIENPFNTMRLCMTQGSFLHFGPFGLTVEVFGTDAAFNHTLLPFLTVSGDTEKNLFQIRISPDISIPLSENRFLKLGVTAQYAKVQPEAIDPETNEEKLYFAAGLSGTSAKNRVSLLYKMQNIYVPEFSMDEAVQSFTVNYSHSFSKSRIALSARQEFSASPESSKKTSAQTIGFYLYPSDFILTAISFSSRFEHKNDTSTPSFSLALTGSKSLKKLKFTAKIQVSTTLLVE